ncbi:MAG: sarcosine oxidase subunit gamma [Gemmobacter sp.]
MAELLATSPFIDLGLPTDRGPVRLEPASVAGLWSIAPFPGRIEEVTKALEPLGLRFPGPGESLRMADVTIFWSGREQAFLTGTTPPDFAGAAAVTDQSDGWAALRLSGPGAVDVLARLVPVDLRPAAAPPGLALRSQLNHMPLALLVEEGGFLLLVFRSMAATAVHELAEAMRSVAARAAAG